MTRRPDETNCRMDEQGQQQAKAGQSLSWAKCRLGWAWAIDIRQYEYSYRSVRVLLAGRHQPARSGNQ